MMNLSWVPKHKQCQPKLTQNALFDQDSGQEEWPF